jgi:regulator of sigma D
MFNSNLPQIENFPQNSHLVQTLFRQRAAVWHMYCEIAGMKLEFANTEKLRPALCKFSQLLIDYVSIGHFGIYERLLTKKQQYSVLSYSNKLYPTFSGTTAAAIMFNDIYDNTKIHFNTLNLATDLSNLGEQLARRMELEDKLCALLLCRTN